VLTRSGRPEYSPVNQERLEQALGDDRF